MEIELKDEFPPDRLRRIDRAVLLTQEWRDCKIEEAGMHPPWCNDKSCSQGVFLGDHTRCGSVPWVHPVELPRLTSGECLFEIMDKERVWAEPFSTVTWSGHWINPEGWKEDPDSTIAWPAALAVCLAILAKHGVEVPE